MRCNKIYQSSLPVMISNRDAASAALPRPTIKEDFLGYLDFSGNIEIAEASEGNFQAICNLFGVIPLKTIDRLKMCRLKDQLCFSPSNRNCLKCNSRKKRVKIQVKYQTMQH